MLITELLIYTKQIFKIFEKEGYLYLPVCHPHVPCFPLGSVIKNPPANT